MLWMVASRNFGFAPMYEFDLTDGGEISSDVRGLMGGASSDAGRGGYDLVWCPVQQVASGGDDGSRGLVGIRRGGSDGLGGRSSGWGSGL